LSVREEALKNPLDFVAKLQSEESVKLPKRQKVAQVPEIYWDKYNLASLHHNKPETRNSKINLENGNLYYALTFFFTHMIKFVVIWYAFVFFQNKFSKKKLTRFINEIKINLRNALITRKCLY